MKKLIAIVFLIFLYSNGLAIPDSVFQSSPVKGMRGLSQQRQSEIDQFNKGMEQLHWGRTVTRDVIPIGGAIGNLVPTDFGESKYDTELAIQDVLSGDKTLNQLRAEKRAEDFEEYLIFFLVSAVSLIVLIAVVLNRKHEK